MEGKEGRKGRKEGGFQLSTKPHYKRRWEFRETPRVVCLVLVTTVLYRSFDEYKANEIEREKIMIAISTIWNSLEHEDGAQLLAELNDLGFNAVQLDCRITEKLLIQMESQIRIGMKVVSVHNFCPAPPGVLRENADADLFLLSSLYKDEREEAVKHTLRTIELAADLEVPVVVLHLGYVDVKEESERLFDLYEWGEREFEAFGKLVTELRGKRERKQQRYQDAVLFSLDKLNRRAMDLNILLGLENRPRYHQIPDFYELELFFAEFKGGNLRYWHDTGHAAIQEKVGILKQEKWLKTYSEQLIGIELHDVKELDEYLAPGVGELDFKEILRYVPEEAVKVLEIKEAENEEEIIEGRRIVEGIPRPSIQSVVSNE